MLKREVGPLLGGEHDLAFDLLSGKMTLNLRTPTIDPDSIIRLVAKTGMRAEVWHDAAEAHEEAGFWQRSGRTILMAASGVFTAMGLAVHAWEAGGLAQAFGSEGLGIGHQVPRAAQLLYSIGIVSGAWYIVPKAWFAARRLRPDMNLLMTLAVLGAVGIGEWFEGATVTFLFAVSLALESWSVGRARRAVAALMKLSPAMARLRYSDGREEEVAVERVSVGSVCIVKPGERIPLDGSVTSGNSEVNQAPITGESVPILKNPGDQVFAGTINGNGALEIKSTKAAGDTTLARIIRMVGEARNKRAASEQWVEKFARVYTPAVMATAVGVMVIPPILFGGVWEDWFYRSLVLLVIGCPCALVISTPVSIVAALAASARHGVLVKGGIYMEAPRRLKVVAFDKTGTLTEGKPVVVEVVPLAGYTEEELLERAAAMEERSDHPLALAIVGFAKARGLRVQPADDFQLVQGKGATAKFNENLYWLGSHRFLEERGLETPEHHKRLVTLSMTGRTVVVLGTETQVCGFIALADAVRPAAARAIRELREAGVQHIVMLTGDNEATAQIIAQQTGVDEIHAELLPADKVAVVDTLVSKYGSVAMVGDGVNDAPAMARATLGIAMGAAGSDTAIETADIALISDELLKLPWLMRHSRSTLAIIHQNVGFSLAVKAVFVSLTFLGYASLWAAIAADMGASLAVIFNGLRLLRRSSAL